MRRQCLEPRPGWGVGQGTFLMPLGGGSVGVLGSTPSFIRDRFMLPPPPSRISHRTDALRPLPFTTTEWKRIIQLLELSPQQGRIVELLVRGASDKQIAAALDLSRHTVRTYLGRIFGRLEVNDRVELVIHVFTSSRKLREQN